jgi:small subunit ribosomal protein S20
MPVIKSAIKKMRKDKLRTARNAKRELEVKKLLKTARRDPNPKNMTAIFSALDKAAKVNLIHINRASRLKSRLSKLAVTK